VTASDRRAQLAAREAELIRALHGGAPPPGLDERMIALASAGITRKRTRRVAKICPALTRDLGLSYEERFAAFAEANPPRDGGTIADAIAFGGAIASERTLSKAATTELMTLRATNTIRRGKLTSRRGPYLAVRWVGRPSEVIVVVRIPHIGVRVFST
jgi:hypothetical protein